MIRQPKLNWQILQSLAVLLAAGFMLSGCATPVQPLTTFDQTKLRQANAEKLALDYFALRKHSGQFHGSGTVAMRPMKNQHFLVPTPEALAQMEEVLIEKVCQGKIGRGA
jgi:ABC-type uncharacterized transport system auxiliary subunit